MKTMYRDNYIPGYLVILVIVFFISSGCEKTTEGLTSQSSISDAQTANGVHLGNFLRVNLNANKQGYFAPNINGRLHNAWGMSASPGGTFWISAADGGVSFVYNNKGEQKIPAVTVPSHVPGSVGNPTGNIFNATPDFIIPGTSSTAKFIFASEDGTISGWNGGSTAVVVADHYDDGAKYTGLDIANDGGSNFLYAANFTEHKVDVFDKDFKDVAGKPFTDPGIPAGYAPFNIRAINNMLYVTYALVDQDGEDSTGKGLGYVDVYWPNGSLSKRLASKGTLNTPWGIAVGSPELTGVSTLLIGNFGDGRINVFDWDGNFKGQLKTALGPIAIKGLWDINNSIANTSRDQLYFTAGPNDEEDGVFGFLIRP